MINLNMSPLIDFHLLDLGQASVDCHLPAAPSLLPGNSAQPPGSPPLAGSSQAATFQLPGTSSQHPGSSAENLATSINPANFYWHQRSSSESSNDSDQAKPVKKYLPVKKSIDKKSSPAKKT